MLVVDDRGLKDFEKCLLFLVGFAPEWIAAILVPVACEFASVFHKALSSHSKHACHVYAVLVRDIFPLDEMKRPALFCKSTVSWHVARDFMLSDNLVLRVHSL